MHSIIIRRELLIAAHNRATKIITPSFEVGDFVLRERVNRRPNDRRHKLRSSWFGSCRAMAIYGQIVYGITQIQGGKMELVHFARLMRYRDYLLGTAIAKFMLN